MQVVNKGREYVNVQMDSSISNGHQIIDEQIYMLYLTNQRLRSNHLYLLSQNFPTWSSPSLFYLQVPYTSPSSQLYPAWLPVLLASIVPL